MRTWFALGCFFLVSLAPNVSSAAPITIGFTGHVTEIIDPAGILAGSGFSPALHDAITGSYTFDSETVGGDLGPNVMNYTAYNSPYGMEFEIAGTSFATEGDPFGFLAINVFDDADLGDGPQDRYVVFTNPGPVAGLDAVQASLEGATFKHLSTIIGTGLPLQLPDFSQFDALNSFGVSLHRGGDFAFVVGRIDTPGEPIPEPAVTALLSLAIGAVMGRRTRIR